MAALYPITWSLEAENAFVKIKQQNAKADIAAKDVAMKEICH